MTPQLPVTYHFWIRSIWTDIGRDLNANFVAGPGSNQGRIFTWFLSAFPRPNLPEAALCFHPVFRPRISTSTRYFLHRRSLTIRLLRFQRATLPQEVALSSTESTLSSAVHQTFYRIHSSPARPGRLGS